MRILFISSEVAPFAKTGGLGDVSAALPKALAAEGHDVRVVVPYYRRVREAGHAVELVVPPLDVKLGRRILRFSTLRAPLPGTTVPVYFVECNQLYDRPSIYSGDGDEHVRFAFLGWAALRIAQQLGFAPDIVHSNDWQAGLVPVALRTVFAWDRLFAETRTVLTIHNIGHQGTFAADVLADVGLANAADQLHQDELRAGRLSFMLTGLLHANAITTVSPTYAREIQTPEHGVGLDAYLRGRRDVLFGILNGIDDEIWNPSRDAYLPTTYSADDLSGKEDCKRALLESVGLPYRRGVPLFGIVSRLAWQKGFDLFFEVLPALLRQHDAQLIVLGSGEKRYADLFTHLAKVAPRKVAYRNAFSEPLAHLIEAGSDLFLMPSRYEPCGLNQLYSLAYGTPPIVHKTGGLADTVRQFDPRTGRGNGFTFDHFDVRGLKWAIGNALDLWQHRGVWRRLQENGMREDLSWRRRVKEYTALYRKLVP
ncbi:MAG: glycogen synthase GlgA [Myxococcales bacterium]|nr:glycogen synthase GlgA [Myxococcales bacterium]